MLHGLGKSWSLILSDNLMVRIYQEEKYFLNIVFNCIVYFASLIMKLHSGCCKLLFLNISIKTKGNDARG